jgi:hypothetical protein
MPIIFRLHETSFLFRSYFTLLSRFDLITVQYVLLSQLCYWQPYSSKYKWATLTKVCQTKVRHKCDLRYKQQTYGMHFNKMFFLVMEGLCRV